MNSSINRRCVALSQKLVVLQRELVRLQERDVAKVLLLRRQEEIFELKDKLGVR